MEEGSDVKLGVIERKAGLEAQAEELRAAMRDSQLNIFRTEARNRWAPHVHQHAPGVPVPRGND